MAVSVANLITKALGLIMTLLTALALARERFAIQPQLVSPSHLYYAKTRPIKSDRGVGGLTSQPLNPIGKVGSQALVANFWTQRAASFFCSRGPTDWIKN